jgi:hypothetical protein
MIDKRILDVETLQFEQWAISEEVDITLEILENLCLIHAKITLFFIPCRLLKQRLGLFLMSKVNQPLSL